MIITGYHGTSDDCANRILKTKQFSLSNGDKEWLGSGIYFYVKYDDAVDWTKLRKIDSPAILHCLIQVEKEAVLDIDSEIGLAIFEKFKILLLELGIQCKSAQRNQCALANMIWQESKNIKVLMASLPVSKTIVSSLIDGRIKRKEICVRDNEIIKSIVKLEVF